MTLAPRVVIVYRRSELDELTERHSTRGQVEFLLRQRGMSFAAVEAAAADADAAVRSLGVAVPHEWRRADVEREDLPQFLFGPEDIVAVVGRDGLVANVAKYLNGQPVVGFNAFPASNAGVLTPFDPADAAPTLELLAAGRLQLAERTMVACTTDDGQSLTALNDIYVGDPGHQSARYELAAPGAGPEAQSSSGVIAGTGTGATGWLRSLANDRALDALLPAPSDARLAWFVREAWPSPYTGVTLTSGALSEGEKLTVTVHSEVLIAFGDGIESDFLSVTHGQRLELGVAPQRLKLAAL